MSGVKTRLSAMMFLQYGIWGAWLPFFYRFFTQHRGLEGTEVGLLLSVGASGALLAPFLAGQIADRWFATEKFLALSHLLGAVLVWQLARLEDFKSLLVCSLLYSLVYAPTISLTNSLAFTHLADRDRDFGKVRVWGTIGWIVAGIGVSQWLLYHHTPDGTTEEAVAQAQLAGLGDSFKLSAVLGLVMSFYCMFFLPHTPPNKGSSDFAPAEAMKELGNRRLWALFLVAFPISCVHQFYFVHTEGFLNSLGINDANVLTKIFGVGGGGLMTIGQMSEIVVLAAIASFVGIASRKNLLTIGLLAYIGRFAIFAYLPDSTFAIIVGIALHGLCFGCFFFVAFMIVDEESAPTVRASAQGLFNLVVIGIGIIVGNLFAGKVAEKASSESGLDYQLLYSIPLWVSIASLVALVVLYPGGKSSTAHPSEAPEDQEAVPEHLRR